MSWVKKWERIVSTQAFSFTADKLIAWFSDTHNENPGECFSDMPVKTCKPDPESSPLLFTRYGLQIAAGDIQN